MRLTYIGDPGRVYPMLQPPARDPEPGKTYNLDADPNDGRWETPAAKTATPSVEEK